MTDGMSVTPAMQQTMKQLPNLKDLITLYGTTEVNVCTTNAVLVDDAERNGVYGITGESLKISHGDIFSQGKCWC